MTYKAFLVSLKLNEFGVAVYFFFNQKWFIDKIYNTFLSKPIFHVGFAVPFRLLDKGFIELVGPLGFASNLSIFSNKASHLQTGLVYHYTFIMLIGLIMYTNIVFAPS
jgi:NADH:ubiquinone oxidoreductase subunit 5 (subunit L)/multisubunit Na+/H+ antiporter MnhA subunit